MAALHTRSANRGQLATARCGRLRKIGSTFHCGGYGRLRRNVEPCLQPAPRFDRRRRFDAVGDKTLVGRVVLLSQPCPRRSRSAKNFRKINTVFPYWCPGEDSNLHGFHHWYLKPARLPIPPPGPRALIRAEPPTCQSASSRVRRMRRKKRRSRLLLDSDPLVR
jgi:hypothetical protein